MAEIGGALMGEFDEFNAPPAPAPAAAQDFGEFDAPAGGEPAAQPETRSFLARGWESIKRGAGAVKNVAGVGLHDVTQKALGAFGLEHEAPPSDETMASRRRELERGVGDVVTLGYGNKLAQKVDELTGEGKFTPEQQARDAEAAPEFRTAGQVGGSFLPNPVGGVLGAAGKVVKAAAPALAAAASKAPAVVKAVAGYEAQAPASAALSADAAGHRLEAAKEAATDPAGLLLSGGAGAASSATSFLTKRLTSAGARAPQVQASAKVRAVKDLGSEITTLDGNSARATDKRRIAEVNDRLYDLADKNPEVRAAFQKPAEKALPLLADFKEKLAAPLDTLYDAIDAHTGGGIKLSTVTKSLRDEADRLSHTVSGLDDAKRLRMLADRFDEAYLPREGATPAQAEPAGAPKTMAHESGWPAAGDEAGWERLEREWAGHRVEESRAAGHKTVGEQTVKGGKGPLPGGAAAHEPTVSAADVRRQLEDLRKLRAGAKGVSAEALDHEIAKLEAEARPGAAAGAAEVVIPTKTFRHEVTDLLKTSESVMGSLEGTPRHEALAKIYDAGKAILDRHIDGSGLAPAEIAKIRDINNGYFLVTRAEGAIESRGWKDANKPGFQVAHGVKQALHSGGLPAVGYAVTHPHAIPTMAAYIIGSHTIPKAIKSANWSLAHGSYGRSIDKLITLARSVPRADFIAQAARAGMGPAAARRIYERANPQPVAQEATP